MNDSKILEEMESAFRRSGLLPIKELCRNEDIELKGSEGHSYCCGERMRVKAGIAGTDYAKCWRCGKTIGDYLSPHINGGIIYKAYPANCVDFPSWRRLDSVEDQERRLDASANERMGDPSRYDPDDRNDPGIPKG